MSLEAPASHTPTLTLDVIPDLDQIANITYSEAEKNELCETYGSTVPLLNDFGVVDGTVVSFTKKDVLVTIGYKSDGLIPIREFRDFGELKQGMTVQVYVETREDKKGRLLLSHSKAKLFQAWKKIKESAENKIPIESIVKFPTKGGLVVEISGIECFLPITQIDYRPVTDIDSYVGKAIDVIVLKINKLNDNVVVSHKAIIEQGVETQKISILGSLERGAILEGVVKNMANFGVFVDLGGVDGLLHITDICWNRIGHPMDVLEMGQKVTVLVLDFDEERKRVSLGMKQLTPHPWDSLPEDFGVGSKVKAKVVCITDYGIFVEYKPGVEGLIHSAELSWASPPNNPRATYALGDEVEAVVIVLDKENRKLAFSIKQLTLDPWKNDELIVKYQVGAIHKGLVKNLAKFGAFVELESGIDGLLYITDFSWTTRVEHPSEFVKVGDEIDVKILNIDRDNKKLSLGIKQTTPNPYEIHSAALQPGSIVQGVISKFAKSSKGAVVKLDFGMDAFVKKENLIKEDGLEAQLGERLDFRVKYFEPEACSIILSHTASYKNHEEGSELHGREFEKKEFRKPKEEEVSSNKTSSTNARSTFANIEGLEELKNRLSGIGKSKDS